MVRAIIPLALGALELSHPTWSDGSIAQAVAVAGVWWIPLHVLLIVGYTLLVWTLWRVGSSRVATLVRPSSSARGPATLARAALGVFLVCNTAFLVVDGVVVGLLARSSNPAAADTVWNAPALTALANVTGAAWSAAMLAVAAGLYSRLRVMWAGLVVVWIVFVAGAFVPAAAVLSKALALGVGAYFAYSAGLAALPFALFALAAVFRQHVGSEAALGMLCVAVALALDARRMGADPATR